MKGKVSDILPFSLNDGPGIRTTVFLKGCPLRCAWCHNPESQCGTAQLFWSESLCIRCGACAAACPFGARGPDGAWDAVRCGGCGACVGVCPAGANRLIGETVTVEETVEQAARDKLFFRDRGGVTFSGGEPLMQADFVAACEESLNGRGIRCAVETSCCMPWEELRPLIPLTDLFLCDWKLTDSALHRQYTGAGNETIRENLARLNEKGARMILRCPIVPGVNDNEAHFAAIGEMTWKLKQIEQVDLLPYHDTGNDKRKRLGLPPAVFPVPTQEQKRAWLHAIQSRSRVPVSL